MMTFRTHGKLSFAQLKDITGTLQICLVKDKLQLFTGSTTTTEIEVAGQSYSAYKFFEKFLDMADFVGVSGELFVTQHGELTLFVHEFQLLSKALLPLPEKRHGIKDADDRLRKRYLDIVMNSEVQAMVQRRGTFWNAMRSFLLAKGFLEVDTPILEVTTG
ncbi:MAG: hypothetical protein H6765_11120 [Candidatus Peribacteria bacterium]|nr:MAG: hypothetical protein H6765_11120 [Candidatus Peribacteria bacterium]